MYNFKQCIELIDAISTLGADTSCDLHEPHAAWV